MARGMYSTVKEANIDIDNDIDIWYTYQPSYSETDPTFIGYKKDDNVRDWIEKSTFNDSVISSYGINNELLGGYKLKLPLRIFNKIGVYTIYLKPKEMFTTITDSDAVLSAYPDIRGVVLRITDIQPSTFLDNGNAVGARISYFNNNGQREDFVRIITSNNRVEVSNDNLSDGSQKAVRYRYNDNSDLVFCTVTPSSSVSTKPNALPFIGAVGQRISITKGNFNPLMIEIEMVGYDEDGLATLLIGNQTRSLDDNVITNYNKNNEIFAQTQVYTLKETASGNEKFQIRENLEGNIDQSKQWDNIVGES